MFAQLANVFRVRELRHRIFLTVLLLAVFRFGRAIPAPGMDMEELGTMFRQQDEVTLGGGQGMGRMMAMVRMISAGSAYASPLALGIMPYISASIIFSLLTNVVPKLEELSKQGEAGRRQIRQYERYTTVLLCVVQGLMILGSSQGRALMTESTGAFTIISNVIMMTAGGLFLVWLGNQITEFGIGNGISLLIMAGIVARLPVAIMSSTSQPGAGGVLVQNIMLMLMFVAVVGGVVLIQLATRRIPTLQPKFTRGRRVYGGQSTHIPLKVNQAGVMPVIFASVIITFLIWPIDAIGGWVGIGWMQNSGSFGYGQFGYMVLFIVMIFFFGFFWTSLTFKPNDMADNLKDYGSVIPGIPQGKKTAKFLEKTMINITVAGCTFLAIIAVIPMLFAKLGGLDPMVAGFFGGTGLLIVVSVALDLVNRIQDQLVMRSYQGFMKRSTVR